MISARRMYLRPGHLYKKFEVKNFSAKIGAGGRPQHTYKDMDVVLSGVLAEADNRQMERFKQLQHPVTHTIVQKGSPLAKEMDKLVLGERVFFVQGVDEPGALGICTIYYVEERKDAQ